MYSAIKCKPGVSLCNLVQVSATHLMVVDVGPGVPDSLQLKQGHIRRFLRYLDLV